MLITKEPDNQRYKFNIRYYGQIPCGIQMEKICCAFLAINQLNFLNSTRTI